LQIGRKTVGRFLRSEIFPEQATPGRKAPRVNKLRAYLQKRWAEGCHNATALYRELKTQGYLGGRSMVGRLVSTFRTPETQYDRKRNQQSAPKAKRRPLSPRQAAMLIAKPAEKLNDAEKQLVTRLEQCCPGIPALQLLVTGFSAVFKNHGPAALQSWIERATATGLAPLPAVERLLGNSHFATNVADLLARFGLPQGVLDLLFGMTFSRHVCSFGFRPEDHIADYFFFLEILPHFKMSGTTLERWSHLRDFLKNSTPPAASSISPCLQGCALVNAPRS
jgi:hypothetical protein